MKRYIYIIVVLMMGATSCKMTEGQEREPIEVGEHIAKEVIANYKNRLSYMNRALVADWYLSTEDEALRNEITDKFLPYGYEYEITHSNDTVHIFYRYIYIPRDEERMVELNRYITDGKLLSEGGTWQTVNYNAQITPAEEGYRFTTTDSDLAIMNVEYDANEGINYTIDGLVNASYKQNSISLDSEITTTLEHKYSNRNSIFKSGAISAVCDDERTGTHDEVKITFKSYYKANVEYRGQMGSVSY
ncbi:MAG: hypothetical protein IIX19_07120 [Alistipes sp.]|nr:hypothetical protein [Alistipes sp.]